MRRRCPCPCWPCWLAVYLFACRWHKGSKTFLNNCNIQTKNFQRISIIANLIILYIIICRIIILSPFGPSLPLAVALVLVVAGPLLVVAGYWYGGQPCRQSVGGVGGVGGVASRSAVTGRQYSPRPVGRRSVQRWRSVGPSASLAAYVINTSVMVADQHHGNGPPWLVGASPYPPTRPPAALSRNFLFFYFFIFLKNREASLTSLRERLAKTKTMI